MLYINKPPQQSLVSEIKHPRWRWIGHVPRMSQSALPRVGLRWTPPGKRKRGRPKEIWRGTAEKEIQEGNLTGAAGEGCKRGAAMAISGYSIVWVKKTHKISFTFAFRKTSEARCSSVVRAFAHGAMGHRIDPSWSGPTELFLVPAIAPRLVYQRPWYVLSCLWDGVYKRTLAVNRKE